MASLQSIKLNQVSVDLEKRPQDYHTFISNFSDMVRTLEYGDLLEDWLDQVLGRNRSNEGATIPSFIRDNPDFVREAPHGFDEDGEHLHTPSGVRLSPIAEGAHGEELSDTVSVGASSTTSRQATLTFSKLLPAEKPLWKLGKEALKLDARLYMCQRHCK